MYTYLISALAVLMVLLYLLRVKARAKKCKRAVKPGTVVLYQFKPTPLVVNASPPCLKLETFLRLTKISYECEYGVNFSKKGKLPWIAFNGQEIADSNFCIQFLSKEFNIDIDSHLTAEQRATGHCIRTMLEENTYWGIVYYRWLTEYAEIASEQILGHLPFPIKQLVFYHLQRKVRGYLWSHGIGRHSEAELYGIIEKDLLAVSEILGNKKFLFGDKPCLADVTLFAFIVSSCWALPTSPYAKLAKSKVQNLEKHALRMKEMFYPDWDEITAKNY